MNKSPCYNCKYRTLSCHMVWESYLNYKRVIDTAKQKERLESDYKSYEVNNVYKFKKARNLSKGML